MENYIFDTPNFFFLYQTYPSPLVSSTNQYSWMKFNKINKIKQKFLLKLIDVDFFSYRFEMENCDYGYFLRFKNTYLTKIIFEGSFSGSEKVSLCQWTYCLSLFEVWDVFIEELYWSILYKCYTAMTRIQRIRMDENNKFWGSRKMFWIHSSPKIWMLGWLGIIYS